MLPEGEATLPSPARFIKYMKQKNPNAKDPHWQLPMELPHVQPEDYQKKIKSGPPDYTLPGHPSGKETATPGKKGI